LFSGHYSPVPFMKKIITGLILLAITTYLYSGFLTKGMLVGTYVNTHFKVSGAEGRPVFADTIKLLDDSNYNSGYWGKGTYKISYTPFGTIIKLGTKNKFRNLSLQTIIRRDNLVGRAKMIIGGDTESYYKID
jgi:hypothetical protein